MYVNPNDELLIGQEELLAESPDDKKEKKPEKIKLMLTPHLSAGELQFSKC